MLEFLRQKEHKHSQNRSLTRTETSRHKLQRPSIKAVSRTEKMFKAVSANAFNQPNFDRRAPEHRKRERRSFGMLQMYFSSDPMRGEAINWASRQQSQNQSKATLQQAEVVKKLEQSLEKDAHRIVVERAIRSFKELETPTGTLTTLNTNRESPATDLERELQQKKFQLQKSLETSKMKILNMGNKNKDLKALSLRRVLSGKSNIETERLRIEYQTRLRDIQEEQARKEQETANRQQQEWLRKLEEDKIRRIQEERRNNEQEDKLKTIEQQNLSRIKDDRVRLQEKNIVENARRREFQERKQQMEKQQKERQARLMAQKSVTPRTVVQKQQEKSNLVPKLQQQFSILSFIAPPKETSAFNTLREETSIEQMVSNVSEISTVNRNKKQTKKEQPSQITQAKIVVNIDNSQPKKTKDIPPVSKKPIKESDDELEEIQLERPKAASQSKPPPPTVTKSPMAQNIPQIIIHPPSPITTQKKPSLPQRPPQQKPPAPPTKPAPPTPAPVPADQASESDQQEVDIDEMKMKLNMVGETIGYGSRDLKGINVNWMIPCFFLYRKFYQLRVMLIKQFQILQKEGIVTKEEIQEINTENTRIQVSLQKMAAACQKKCTNPELKPKFKQKFQANVSKTLYETTSAYVRELANVEDSLSKAERDKVKQHLLQILNSILIIQQFEGKKTNPLTTEQLFSMKIKANLDAFIKQHYQRMLKS